MTAGSDARPPIVIPPTPFTPALYRVVRVALVAFARVWFRIRAEGVGHVPRDRPFILAPVHRSNLDFLLVLVCARQPMRFLAKDTLWRPGWGRLWNRLGAIPVARGTADRDALRACIEVIEGGDPLVMFPEGTRQHGPEVQPLFDGPAYVQARTGVPIVPVGIGGSEAAMPRGAKLIRPHRVRVVVGPPLEAPVVDGPRARRSAIREQTARLKVVVQELFDRAQEQAGTPNR